MLRIDKVEHSINGEEIEDTCVVKALNRTDNRQVINLF